MSNLNKSNVTLSDATVSSVPFVTASTVLSQLGIRSRSYLPIIGTTALCVSSVLFPEFAHAEFSWGDVSTAVTTVATTGTSIGETMWKIGSSIAFAIGGVAVIRRVIGII